MITTERLRAIATDLSLLPETLVLDLGMVTEVLHKHRVTATEFMLLDDTPGRLGYDLGNGRGWHWKLRLWRNSGPMAHHHFDREET